ncbi:MAG TPA: GNAT family N-acetyltransferase, partial [Pyrinomonadaceae bacterium]|nr:GNAT family N-acetyltransferase [Pyrinomonadaceae bacterium]
PWSAAAWRRFGPSWISKAQIAEEAQVTKAAPGRRTPGSWVKSTLAMKQSRVEIRMAVAGEASAIASVLADSFAEYQALYTDEGFAATTPDTDRIRKRMSEGPLWVALQDEVVVGTVAAVSKGPAFYIRGMAVLPAVRGQKVGELLLAEIENYAAVHGHQTLRLSTTPFLSRAIRLYEHFGFQRSSEGPHDLFGTPLFTMVKILRPAQNPGASK